jgi:hypothetical protein
MATREIVLCDTDVFIEFYKGNSRVISNLKSISEENIAISIITVGELLFGAFNKKELAQLIKDFQKLFIIHLDNDIGNEFI